MAYKYFLFSQQYYRERNELEDMVGKQFLNGQVVVDGTEKEFNILSDVKELDRYPDYRYITEGDTDNMVYTKPKTKPRRT